MSAFPEQGVVRFLTPAHLVNHTVCGMQGKKLPKKPLVQYSSALLAIDLIAPAGRQSGLLAGLG